MIEFHGPFFLPKIPIFTDIFNITAKQKPSQSHFCGGFFAFVGLIRPKVIVEIVGVIVEIMGVIVEFMG